MTLRARLGLAVGSLAAILIAMSATALVLNERAQMLQRDAIARTGSLVADLTPLAQAIQDLQIDVLQVQQFLTDAAATHHLDSFTDSAKYAADVPVQLAAIRAIAPRVRAAGRAEAAGRLEAGAAQIETAFPIYNELGIRMAHDYIDKGIEVGNDLMEKFDPLAEGMVKQLDTLLGTVHSLVADGGNGAVAALRQGEAQLERSGQIATGLAGGGLLICLLSALLVAFGVARPLLRLVHDMRAEAGVDPKTKVRGSEIGAMTAALAVFRTNNTARLRLEREAAAASETARIGAAAQKTAALRGMADTIEIETKSAVEVFAKQAAGMQATSRQMSDAAERAGAQSGDAAIVAGQALARGEAVAVAASQLSEAINEISVQVSRSTSIVRQAVAAGGETRKSIDALGERVAKIGAVADIIADIARKTNLLALNATIEAARAGDAGKGFAVVASEVKALAIQTARSTEEITRNIVEVRGATQRAAESVGGMERTVSDIETVAGSIAAAVEQQHASTSEISRAIGEAAGLTQRLAGLVDGVAGECGITRSAAAETRERIVALEAAMTGLKTTLVRSVRTATEEVDRRLDRRTPASRACTVLFPGGAPIAAQLADLSSTGAGLTGVEQAVKGARGVLSIEGVEQKLPFRVEAVRDGAPRILGVAFEMDAAAAARFAPILARLADKRAA